MHRKVRTHKREKIKKKKKNLTEKKGQQHKCKPYKVSSKVNSLNLIHPNDHRHI